MRRTRPAGAAPALLGLGIALGCNPVLSSGGTGPGRDDATPPLRFPTGDAAMSQAIDPDDGAACAEQTYAAKPLPVDMIVLLDSSNSMNDAVAGNKGLTKWMGVRGALTSFLNDPRTTAAGAIGAGLQYFPDVDYKLGCLEDSECGHAGPCHLVHICRGTGVLGHNTIFCSADAECGAGGACVWQGKCSGSPAGSPVTCTNVGGACDGALGMCEMARGYCEAFKSAEGLCSVDRYAMLTVPIADLPAGAAPIVDSIARRQPSGGTPMTVAAMGSLAHLQGRAGTMPDRKYLLVLATDGQPTACYVPGTHVGPELAKAQAGPPGIPTYVIGLLSEQDRIDGGVRALDDLAQAGGTGSALMVDVSQDVTAQFLGALNQIRISAIPCQYPIPQMDSPTVDYGKVNIAFVSSNGDMTVIGHVTSKERCSAVNGGWYYDVDPGTGKPTRIIPCALTCDGLKQDMGGKLEIRYGCKTKLIE